jgi:CheY-like chemotaxis protein
LILPNIPRQSPKIKAERIEKLSLKLVQTLPVAYFNFFSEIVRGMPEEARLKLLSEFAMKNKKILLVDDEPQIRSMFMQFLSKHDVREAKNGRIALEILQSGFTPDYVITDYNMQGMSGLDLAKEIRKKHISQIFVYSGDDSARGAAEAIANTTFVDKSFEGLRLIIAAISNNTL